MRSGGRTPWPWSNAYGKSQDLPGQQLFEYVDPDGKIVEICFEDVNEYLQTTSGQPFTAKGFSDLGRDCFSGHRPGSDGSGGQQSRGTKNVITAVEAVARMLGNTAAIWRKCCIHPAIITRYMDGRLARTL
jgi:DNA topoisomerase-1